MKIQMRLSEDSIQEAIDKIEAYRNKLPERMKELCERLALVGADVLRYSYTGALYAGDNDIEVSVDLDGNTAILRADGRTLGFIEFGTGVNYPMGEYGDKLGAPPHGSYGKHRGATGRTWAYYGSQGTSGIPVKSKPGLYRTDGNGPANAFPASMRAMRDEITRIAREVFSSD